MELQFVRIEDQHQIKNIKKELSFGLFFDTKLFDFQYLFH